jgi:hypothetical protein
VLETDRDEVGVEGGPCRFGGGSVGGATCTEPSAPTVNPRTGVAAEPAGFSATMRAKYEPAAGGGVHFNETLTPVPNGTGAPPATHPSAEVVPHSTRTTVGASEVRMTFSQMHSQPAVPELRLHPVTTGTDAAERGLADDADASNARTATSATTPRLACFCRQLTIRPNVPTLTIDEHRPFDRDLPNLSRYLLTFTSMRLIHLLVEGGPRSEKGGPLLADRCPPSE